jgi:hypothetical protein
MKIKRNKEKPPVVDSNKVIRNSNGKNKDLKTPIIEIVNTSSLQFILNPIKSNNILMKLVWITFLIFSLICSFYYVYLNIKDYLHYDTITSIYHVVEEESEFPTVSFCSPYNLEIKLNSFWFNSNNLINEWQNHLEAYNDTSQGKCFRFNSGLNMLNQKMPYKYLKVSGRDAGLMIYFYSNTSLDYGELIVSIQNHTQMPRTIYNKGIWISPGSINSFLVNRIYDQKLEHPYNDCYKNISLAYSQFNKTIIEFILNRNRIYTQKECFAMCRNLNFNETNTCRCYLNELDEELYKKCYVGNSNLISQNCVVKFQADFNHKTCMQYCPSECDSFSYDITLTTQSIIAYGNISLNSTFAEFLNYANLTRTFYGIRVFYEDLRYTWINQQAKIELFGLVSNVGGILGLFLGFSFVSLMEIFEIIFEFFYILVRF